MHDASAKSFSAQAVPGVDGAIWATPFLDQRSPGKILIMNLSIKKYFSVIPFQYPLFISVIFS